MLRTLVPIEREVHSQTNQWFLIRITPYRTVEDRIDGIVITFVDVTALKASESALLDAKEYSEKIVNEVNDGLMVLESDLSVQFANASFLEMFQVSREETLGRLIYQLGNGQWDIPKLRELLEEILPQANVVNDYRVEHEFESIGRRVMLLNAQRLNHSNLILLIIKDISEQERLHQTEKELVAIQERQHLARDLHDSVSQTLYSAAVLAESILRKHELNPAGPITELLQELAVLSRAALAEMRSLLLELRPDAISKSKLKTLLSQLVEASRGRKVIAAELKFEGSEETLPDDVLMSLYRIAQESINNILKHSEATSFVVDLNQQPQTVLLRVSDNGVGFDTTKSSSGFGLGNIRERTQEIGASLEITSQPGLGTTISVSWHKQP